MVTLSSPAVGEVELGLLQLPCGCILEGSGITSCQLLWGPDADALAILLNRRCQRDANWDALNRPGCCSEISYT